MKGLAEGFTGLGVFLGGVAAAIAMLLACLPFGPIGWVAALVLVPVAFALGGAAGGVLIWIAAGGGILLWLMTHAAPM